MRFGKTDEQRWIEHQASEWAYALGVKRFVWWPERLESGETVWLETIVQQWGALLVTERDGEVEVEGCPLKTYSLKEWDEEGYDNHEVFVGSCPSRVKDLMSKYNIAKIPSPGRGKQRGFNSAIEEMSIDEILSDLKKGMKDV